MITCYDAIGIVGSQSHFNSLSESHDEGGGLIMPAANTSNCFFCETVDFTR